MSTRDEFSKWHGDTQLPAEPDRVGASDMRQASAARRAQQTLPLGSPPADYGVRSVYDSRPVSGTDFNQWLRVGVGTSDLTADASFTVPIGYVAVLREIQTWVEPIALLTQRSDIEVSPQVNGADNPYTNQIPVGNGTDLPLKCFIIVDETQSLGVRFYNNAGISATLNALLYGNLLLKTGRPAQFEIANYAGTAKAFAPGEAPTVAPTSGLGQVPAMLRRRRIR